MGGRSGFLLEDWKRNNGGRKQGRRGWDGVQLRRRRLTRAEISSLRMDVQLRREGGGRMCLGLDGTLTGKQQQQHPNSSSFNSYYATPHRYQHHSLQRTLFFLFDTQSVAHALEWDNKRTLLLGPVAMPAAAAERANNQ